MDYSCFRTFDVQTIFLDFMSVISLQKNFLFFEGLKLLNYSTPYQRDLDEP